MSLGAALTLLLVTASAAAGQSAAVGLYNEANRHYAEGDYQQARDLYLQAVAAGVRDARLFYNLGNAYYKAGELGEAILWYERARRLAPRDPDIRHNLRFANARKADADPVEGGGLWRALAAAFSYPTPNELCATASVALLALFALGCSRVLGWASARTAWTVALVAAACVLALTGVWLGARIYHSTTTTEAVLTAPEAQARSGPDEGQTVVFAAHEGTKGGWLPVDVLAEI